MRLKVFTTTHCSAARCSTDQALSWTGCVSLAGDWMMNTFSCCDNTHLDFELWKGNVSRYILAYGTE